METVNPKPRILPADSPPPAGEFSATCANGHHDRCHRIYAQEGALPFVCGCQCHISAVEADTIAAMPLVGATVRYVAIQNRVMRGLDWIATCPSHSMAKRVAVALNFYRQQRKDVSHG